MRKEDRSHAVFGMILPTDVYDFSPRQVPMKLPEHEFASSANLRRVRTGGSIRCCANVFFRRGA